MNQDVSAPEEARMLQAQWFLADINKALRDLGVAYSLKAIPVDGDGFCLFRSLAWAVLGDPSTHTARLLYACGLLAFLQDNDTHAAYANEDIHDHIMSLMMIEQYTNGLHEKTPLEIMAMCKFEALLNEQPVLQTSLYGDAYELMPLLKSMGLRFLKLDVTSNANHVVLPIGDRLPDSQAIARRLLSEPLDAVLLHWSEEHYEHYAIVSRSDTDSPWCTGTDVARERMRKDVDDGLMCTSLIGNWTGGNSVDEARACFLSVLPGSTGSQQPIGFSICWDMIIKNELKRVRIPRGNYLEDRGSVQDFLRNIFPAKDWYRVNAMAESLQWFFNMNYPLFKAYHSLGACWHFPNWFSLTQNILDTKQNNTTCFTIKLIPRGIYNTGTTHC